MAKQNGIVSLNGTIGNITFFKTKHGYVAREYAPLSAKRIAKDPAFQRTRENAAEFGRAAKAVRLLRTAFRNKLLHAKDNGLNSRLVSELLKVIKTDTLSQRGKRKVANGQIDMLQDFNFNAGSLLTSTFYASYEVVMDRTTGQCTTSMEAFVPSQAIVAPEGATHYRISALAAEIGFDTGFVNSDTKETGFLLLDNMPAAAFSLENTLTPESQHPLFLALGIEFTQIVNDEHYPLKDGEFNSLALVKVSRA